MKNGTVSSSSLLASHQPLLHIGRRIWNLRIQLNSNIQAPLSKNKERLRIESQQFGCCIISTISFSKEQLTVWKRNVEV